MRRCGAGKLWLMKRTLGLRLTSATYTGCDPEPQSPPLLTGIFCLPYSSHRVLERIKTNSPEGSVEGQKQPRRDC